MAETTIEWTATRLQDGRALPGYTFNPWEGCQKISPGCDNCYAEARNVRFVGGINWGPRSPRRRTSAANWAKPLKWNAEAEEAGIRRKVFCASLADVFDNHDSIDDQWRRDLGDIIRATPHLDWLLLTKRIGIARTSLLKMFGARFLPGNVWLGATLVNQTEIDRDAVKLAQVARDFEIECTFWSMEPLLGEVNILDACLPSWIICGGESGHGARPVNPMWVRSLRDQAKSAHIPFFFKQWGEFGPLPGDSRGGVYKLFDDGVAVERLGKQRAGRLLDGREWNEVPVLL